MAKSTPTYNGKYKGEIVQEAFAKYGPEASFTQVNRHLKEYGCKSNCEQSMYYHQKGIFKKSKGLPTRVACKVSATVEPIVTPNATSNLVDIVQSVRVLVSQLGKEDAKRLIDLL